MNELLILCRYCKRAFASPFTWTFCLFLFAQVVFLVGIRQDEFVSSAIRVENAQTAFLLTSVFALVCCNTMCFLVGEVRWLIAQDNRKELKDADRGALKFRSVLCLVLFIGSAFISGAMAVLVVSKVGEGDSIRWGKFLEFAELITVLIFSVFVVADIVCITICRMLLSPEIHCEEPERERFRHIYNVVVVNVLAVDLPGVLGIVLIVTLSRVLHNVVPGYYWHGFVAGAISLHIMFSQAVLAFVSAIESERVR
jgi:hypothetical protein